jgi:hypothetical protein
MVSVQHISCEGGDLELYKFYNSLLSHTIDIKSSKELTIKQLQTLKGDEYDRWFGTKGAITKELEALDKHVFGPLIPLPKGTNAVGT